MINVTKPIIPNKRIFYKNLNKIFQTAIFSNNGYLVRKLEKKLQKYFNMKHVICVSNGTVALQVAYLSLEKKGNIITSPFTFISSVSSISTQGFAPVFADIDVNNLNIHPDNIKKLIDKKTLAVSPTAVFGNPYNLDNIYKICKKNRLKMILDASHAFGVRYRNKSIFEFADISTISFHATKQFHTAEGGAIITNDSKLAKKMRAIINFGINEKSQIEYLGLNGKMSELNAALGLSVFDFSKKAITKRKKIFQFYVENISKELSFQEWPANSKNNFLYAPIIFENEKLLLSIKKKLNDIDIYPRRYFYPSLDKLKIFQSNQKCKISNNIANRILCLPIYSDLRMIDCKRIISVINNNIN